MKEYINTFYDIITKIQTWNTMSKNEKKDVLSNYIYLKNDHNDLVDYFDNYMLKLSNSTLNSLVRINKMDKPIISRIATFEKYQEIEKFLNKDQ